ncbi:MAG TPA: methyl-accepting chemotaxis protein [Bryobacteraceae bacterium]|jgi:methyl-accepting chemotaxis protein/methyl-accepting chemotaxis protein-1 (serine sensor receptor)
MFRMTMGRKLTASFIVLLAFLVALGFSSLRAVSNLGAALDRAVNQTSKKIDAMGSMREDFDQVEAQVRKTQVGFGIQTLDGKQGYCTFCHTADQLGQNSQKLDSAVAATEGRMADLGPLMVQPEEQKSLEDLRKELTSAKGVYHDYVKEASVDFGEAHGKLREQLFPSLNRMREITGKLAEEQRTSLVAENERAREEVSQCRWIAFGLIGLNVAIGLAALFTVRRSCGQLRQVAGRMGKGAVQVDAASRELSSSSGQLAQGASEQAAALQETSASSEEITSITHRNAENAQQSAAHMERVDREVSDANRALEQMTGSMTGIQEAGKEISRIVKTIDGLAFRTNILALNAAVEAARAGEAGAGFAVVAQEVRSLAQRSAEAARETTAMIEKSLRTSEEGSRKLEEMAHAIGAITGSTRQVKILVDQVNAGSQEQARGIQQVNKAILEMQQVTQNTAANAEESSATSETLRAEALALRTAVDSLQSMVNGQGCGEESCEVA